VAFGGQAAARATHAAGSVVFLGFGGVLMHPDGRVIDENVALLEETQL